ncbi:MAG: PD-(D/E)XK nuclease family protein [Methanoregula sp.]|nr:PD-(D/E)XK nuclease family protein [Methanoregula sp.]
MSRSALTTRDVVQFLTAHKSKGKELPVVFVTNVSIGRFPQRNQSKLFYVPNDLSKGLKTGYDDMFQYVLLVPSSPRTFFSFGQAVHGVIEQVSKNFLSGFAFTNERTLLRLAAKWDPTAYPSKMLESEDRRKADALLDTFLSWQAQDTNTIVATELHFTFRFCRRIVKGYIDRIGQQPGGRLVVIDFKTGSSAGMTKNTIREDIQMNLYCIVVQEIYGKIPVRASLFT